MNRKRKRKNKVYIKTSCSKDEYIKSLFFILISDNSEKLNIANYFYKFYLHKSSKEIIKEVLIKSHGKCVSVINKIKSNHECVCKNSDSSHFHYFCKCLICGSDFDEIPF
jgi:hypothetical protein